MTPQISNTEQGISNYEVKVVRNIAPYMLYFEIRNSNIEIRNK
jgi:hypothetical protein